MEVVGSAVIQPAVKRILALLKEHIGYMISCNKHVKDMRDQMTELDGIKCDVEERKNQNTERRLELPVTPVKVDRWLDEVRETDERVKNVATDVGTCFPIYRHKLGVKALEIIKKIKCLKEQHSRIVWNDIPIPLGRVDTLMASTSTPSSDHHNGFRSRDDIITKALQALSFDNASQMIALCGMGGVGKTTIMEELWKVVAGRKMFNYIVKVVIGQNPDPIVIQKTVAHYLGIELKESTKSQNVDELHTGLKAKASVGMIKLLIIMDDVWQSVDLKDIGLSPPVQGVHFKVLLTSRLDNVCSEMGVEANNVLKVGLLEEEEAQSFFRKFFKTFDDVDPPLHKIGEDIARKCGGLPIAIKTMARTLRGKHKDTWKDALLRLERYDNEDVVNAVFQLSYDNLQDAETKSVFLMCGLYPEDFDIPTEELVRYGWGLKTFKLVSSVTGARIRLNTCIEKLINANLLLKSDDAHGCVKMHDLVLAFVLNMFSEKEHASIVRHGSMSGWPEDHISDSSWKNISLTCRGMSEFRTDIKFPNLLFLKLMHGDKSLKFPQDFYGEMKKLRVISYDNMSCPLLQTSPQYSTNLRVLHLHECSLTFDCSFIGDLLNLEVLSFANSEIERLPSRIGNLKKLRLLDLTNCRGLRVDNGVLKNLVKLEEIYAIVEDRYKVDRDAVSFTYDDLHEMAKRSKNLLALEFKFFDNNAPLENMSFENLERFKISVGGFINGSPNESNHSFQNTLELVISKDEILETKIYELFEKTEGFCLSVDGMNGLEDIVVNPLHPLQFPSFYNLRNLVVWRCAVLKYLFTLGVAKALSKQLEHLQVYECDTMKALIHTEGGGEETISFPKLKFLSLKELPKLSCLCDGVNILELPQLESLNLKGLTKVTSIFSQNKLDKSSFFSEEAVIPKLEVLHIDDMKNLKAIWPCDFSLREEVKLRSIEVSRCGSLVNIFPCNAMPLLHHLEELQFSHCGSIEALFEIDLDSLGETGEVNSSSLRSIKVSKLCNLRHVWRIKGESNSCIVRPSFKAIESIEITRCLRFTHLWTPTTISFDLGALVNLKTIIDASKLNSNQEVETTEEEEFPQVGGVSWSLCQYAREITISFCNELSSVIPCYAAGQMQKLQVLYIWSCTGMKEIFETQEMNNNNNNKSGFDEGNSGTPGIPRLNNVIMLPNLKILKIYRCKRLEHIFTFSTLESLRQLEELEIMSCDGMKVIVKEEDDKEQTTTASSKEVVVFPRLKSIILIELPELEGFFLGKNEFMWSSLDKVTIRRCPKMMVFAPGGSTTPLLKYVHTDLGKYSVEECGLNFHVKTAAHHQTPLPSSCPATSVRMPWSSHNLIELHMSDNDVCEKIITSNELLQLQKLEKIDVSDCDQVQEVFEALEGGTNSSGFDQESQTTLLKLPNLRQVNLKWLNSLRHIWKSNQWTAFEFPNLTTVTIDYCGGLKRVFTSSMAGSLLQLQELRIINCHQLEEVFGKDTNVAVEEEEKESDGKMNEIIMFPRLKSLGIWSLSRLKGFCLGKENFSFPLLDTVLIDCCPAITTFTNGNSATPELKSIKLRFNVRYAAGEDINSIIKINQEEIRRRH